MKLVLIRGEVSGSVPRNKPYTGKAIYIYPFYRNIWKKTGRKMRKSEAKNPPRLVHQKFTKFFIKILDTSFH